VAEQVVSSFERHPQAMRLVFTEGLKDRHTARIVYEGLLHPSAEALARLLEGFARRGLVRTVDTEVVASAFLGTFAFYLMVTQLYMPTGGLEASDSRDTLLEQLTEVFARGLEPAGSAQGAPGEVQAHGARPRPDREEEDLACG
jgi:hypothetical protein